MRSSIQQNDDDKNQIENKLAQPTIVKYGADFILFKLSKCERTHRMKHTRCRASRIYVRDTQSESVHWNKQDKKNHSSSLWIVNCSSQTKKKSSETYKALSNRVQYLAISTKSNNKATKKRKKGKKSKRKYIEVGRSKRKNQIYCRNSTRAANVSDNKLSCLTPSRFIQCVNDLTIFFLKWNFSSNLFVFVSIFKFNVVHSVLNFEYISIYVKKYYTISTNIQQVKVEIEGIKKNHTYCENAYIAKTVYRKL